LNNAIAVLYTPSNEHFGIVPVESMFMKTPVLACNNGGPLESVRVNNYLLIKLL
jgi:alpha-1,3/alpha-1,6-mannosyltransferase